jgi:hypothetical protein
MTQTRARGFGLFFIFTLAISVAAFAANPNMGIIDKAPAEIGDINVSASSIQWSATGTYDRLILTVSGPENFSLSKEYEAGRVPSLRLQDLGMKAPVDGNYTWQLRAVPRVSPDVKRRLAEAREKNDEEGAARIQAQAGLTQTVSASGSFGIAGGMFVRGGNESEGPGKVAAQALKPVPLDQVYPDDVIVQGSLCVGLDCVNNESFGFDTIRMKENNTRIKFDDTSTTGGCPANDWQLTANDACGGASKFSIEDISGVKVPFTITAGAATNSIFVDSTGRVGFRTSTPVLDLHVSTSNTPALRLEQNNSGGFTAQTWDVAGNEANFFVRDVTSGSRLPFRIRPGAPTSSLDISADGDIGIGTGSPDVRLHVFSTATSDVFVGLGPDPANNNVPPEAAFNIGYGGASFGRGAGFLNSRPDASATAPNPSLRFATGNTVRMIIDNEGFIGIGGIATGNPTSPIHYTNGGITALLTTAGAWQDNSSRATKEHITDLSADTAITALRELKPVTYNYKIIPDDPKVGFIAEDVPSLVAAPDRKGLSALDIVAVVTKVVQEQQKTIDQLNERISELEKEKKQ